MIAVYQINDRDFLRLTGFIKDNYGINLTKKRTLIEGRLSNLIYEKGFENFSAYLDYVFADKTGDEIIILINKLTTNHTYFMREFQHFEFMRNNVLPNLARTVKNGDLRMWSAGCSTGEEPYTMEMLLHDFFGKGHPGWDTSLLATDLSSHVLNIAKKGIYSAESIKNIPQMWKLNYFEKIGNEDYKVKDQIKRDIVYRMFNLMTEQFPFRKRFHVIFCRNVMIYFDQQTKDRLVNRFYDFTEPGGYLFIGHSESINKEATKYQYIMPAVYRKI